MGEKQRVFITGYSALTPSGESAQATWQSIIDGQSAIAEITQWDLQTWDKRLGGELKEFKPQKSLPDRKLLKVISTQDAMGIVAAVDAVTHSGIAEYQQRLSDPTDFNEETAVYVGSPGNKYLQQYDFLPLIAKTSGNMQDFAHQLFAEVHPMWLLRILPNNVLAYTGITFGFKGPNHNITNHAVGGVQAIIEAFRAIQTGQAKRAIVAAYDLGTEPQALYYYDKLGLISPDHLKPFDKAHNGTLLADGACALVLESEESANARGTYKYAELLNGSSTTESAGLFSIENEGDSLTQLLQQTLISAEIQPQDIGFITAHGNGNPKSDLSEAAAIGHVFAQANVPVTAFKWAMGHTLCTSGALDTILSVMALNKKTIPGIANLEETARGCSQLNVSASHRQLHEKHHALVINRGFASMNACLVLKACE